MTSLPSSSIFSLTFFLAFVFAIRFYSQRQSDKALAPHAKTFIPWLGGAFQCALNMPDFISRSMRTCGRNFRVIVAGKQMVFISDPRALQIIFSNRHHQLRLGKLHDVLPRTLGGVRSYKTTDVLHEQLLATVVQGNTGPSVEEIGCIFNSHLYARLLSMQSTHSGEEVSLRQFISDHIMQSIYMAIWGPSFPSYILPDLAILDENSYYLALSLPFLPYSISRARRRSRQALIDFIRDWKISTSTGVSLGCSSHGNAIMRTLTQSTLSDGDQAGLLVAYMFATVSNMLRLSFWLFAHLIHDEDAYKRVRDEVDRGVEELGDFNTVLALHPQMVSGSRFRLLHSAIKEAARLHSLPSSIREVEADIEFPSADGQGSFWALPGDVIIANHLAIHTDEHLFSDARVFRADRFLAPELSPYIYAWGKGEHICPGRHLAFYVIKMFTIICLHRFDLVPVNTKGITASLPPDNPHSLTVTRPTQDLQFFMRPRSFSSDSKAW